VRRLGKGTGKYAARYRSQARESLRECQDAVPAWIMPLYQVTETVPSDLAGRFDVVIIDEASQSGPEALLLAWLGAKIVVVGDDKQVSPANVGVDEEQLFQLQSRLLGALPASRRNLFTPKASFFDIASGLAGGTGRLMLQEHFRCMPEIIGFSNELCYGGKLQPLRQYGADRLPPLRTVHVPDGYIEGTGQKQINRIEAEQLADQLVRCCADPAYEGRTMGVITMLGAAQKNLIEDLLAEQLPLTVRQARQLRVGDAEDFQGDERDIMYLSTVVSLANAQGRHRPGTFSSDMHQQRINVAASRARDQVWVFHSVSVSDLGETDLRRRYLDYLARPAEQQDGLGLDDVTPNERHDAFDSLFEQRVFLALRQRGYRVRPQYPAGRYRIDLVVEGGSKRLAVECDGDAFHNEENAEADAARQRELERVGWTFVRIRGSRFFLDPEAALEPLWAVLNRLGIEAHGEARQAAHTSPAAVHPPLSETEDRPVPQAAQPESAQGNAVPTNNASESTRKPGPSTPHNLPASPHAPQSKRPPSADESGDFTPVPEGFGSVGWIRKSEAHAAQLAFSLRAEVPVEQGGRVTGVAKPAPRAGIPGLPGADVVEVTRGSKISARLLLTEVQAILRSSIARTDVPVLIGDEHIGLVQYFPPGSAEVQRFRSTMRLLRRRGGPMSPQPPASATHQAETPAVQPRSGGLPVDRLSLNAFRRVQSELDRIQEALAQPTPEFIAVDPSSRTAQLESDRRRRTRLDHRRQYLRGLLAKALPDPRYVGGHLVGPGCLVEIEDKVGLSVYEITAVRPLSADHEWLTPDSPLGQALMGREVGDEVSYRTEAGSQLSVVIRSIED
jgi:transcription elongation GreA/GreB family factor/very-short-patch-repair endonuclease